MLSEDIKEMPVKQRLMLIEEIWNSLSNSEPEIESPDWHEEIIKERKNLIKSDKAEYISIKELKNLSNERQ